MPSEDLKRSLGSVPPPIATVVTRLWHRASRLEPPKPLEIGYSWLNSGVAHSTIASEALIDARSMLTAFAREVANPRPTLGDLARAQGVSLSTLRRRYTPEQVDAVRHLINDTGYVDDIIRPFASLFDLDLRGISTERDQELDDRNAVAEAYAQREDALAEQMGLATRADLTAPAGAEDLLPPLPAYYEKPTFETGKLYPGRRRRLLTEYNERILADALDASAPELKERWASWVSNPTEHTSWNPLAPEDAEESEHPPF